MADTTESHGADGATDAAHGAADAAHGGAEAVGMPQLDFSTFPNQIFWLIVALIAIYMILNKVALPRIASVLADRQGAITSDIAAAEELKLKAVEAEAAYEKALASARAESAEIIAAARQEIQVELDEAIAKADAEISERAAQSEKAIGEIQAGAMESVEAVAKSTAGEIVSALGLSADRAAVDGAVAARLKG
ncbi:MAG: F0F1 ATP synthase subunit B' [Rhodobacteraceae bacterium]|nr:F0F1 ATP synthase subunit B' [Paracoccaceae bacterium]